MHRYVVWMHPCLDMLRYILTAIYKPPEKQLVAELIAAALKPHCPMLQPFTGFGSPHNQHCTLRDSLMLKHTLRQYFGSFVKRHGAAALITICLSLLLDSNNTHDMMLWMMICRQHPADCSKFMADSRRARLRSHSMGLDPTAAQLDLSHFPQQEC